MNKRIGKKRSFFWDKKEVEKNECEQSNANFFTKFCKKLFGQCESQLSKKKSSASFEPFRTKNKNTANLDHHRHSLIDNYYIRPKPSLSVLENNISEWKTELLQELDATQYKCDVTHSPSQHHIIYRHDGHSVYSHDPTMGDIQHLTIGKNEREPCWLKSPFTKDETTTDPRLTSTIRSVCSSNASSHLSTESQRHDHVKERLELAAARRNEIKNNRLREQMDSALFETMRMLRQEQYEQYQQQGGLIYKGKKVYQNSLFSDHLLAINQMDNHQRQPSNDEEQTSVW
ncbi:hypothetical protein BD560DRAFT_491778 [Blakeslea trispora]|nr:hypothetical protein BD560DRAFT_491778 [Blakeslea trispora]